MTNSKYASVQSLHATERRIQQDLAFTAICKNTNKEKVFDFSKKKYAKTHREILEIYVWSIYKLRNKSGNTTKVSYYEKCNSFFEFLEQNEIYKPRQIDTALFSRYIEWLKRNERMSYSTAASVYRSLRTIFNKMGSHPKINKKIYAPRNAFPKSTSLQSVDIGYDDHEFKQILRSVVKCLRESKQRFEHQYEPKYLGKEPPLKGVATFVPRTGAYAIWATHEHRVWFFENIMKCQLLTSHKEFSKVDKGHQFWYALKRDYPHPEYKNVEEFYEYIGAGPSYQPRYLNQPSPVQYITPWKKWEYVLWYWENIMDGKSYTDSELKEQFREFQTAMKEHWGSAQKVFEKLNAWTWVSSYDLAPYYLMIILRTGLNPSTVHGLDVDCIKTDPLNPSRRYIDWEKYRSHTKDSTIPEEKSDNDTWAVSIIDRVINITSKIRPEGVKDLWISNANPQRIPKTFTLGYFQAGVRRIFEKYPVYASNTGAKLKVVAKNIRPTIAWNEYLRTEDLQYLQTLLGHANTSTTSDYLRRLNDPLFRTRRAIHSEAMLIGLTEGIEQSRQHLENNRAKIIVKDEPIRLFDGLLNHCQDPAQSPVQNQAKGQLCSAPTDVCHGCQNLAITPEDIKKHFCYLNFHEYLLSIGEISELEFEKAVSGKRHFWDEYILPKYPDLMVREIQDEAAASPIPIWDPKRYEEQL